MNEHHPTDHRAGRCVIDRRRFVQATGALAGATALAGAFPIRAQASWLPPGASAFHALPAPVRVADTRPASHVAGYRRHDDLRISVDVRGRHGVPETATAIVATVTGVNAGPPNWVAVFPSGGHVPVVSNLNLIEPGVEASANLVTVKLGWDGAIDLATRVPCDLLVDLIGYYEPISGPVAEGRYVGLDAAVRVYDSRPGAAVAGSTTVVDLSAVVPPDASAAVINLTATETTGAGYCTVYPVTLDERPASSSLNWNGPDATRAAAVIAQVSNQWNVPLIKIDTVRSDAKLIVDVTGYFTGPTSVPSTSGAFVPLDPVRILDTRRPEHLDPQTPGGVLWPRWSREVPIPGDAGANASSVLVNLTGTASRGPGFLTIWPARHPWPGTSNLNFSKAGATVPNHAITRITSGSGVQVMTSHGAALIVDLNGYFVGTPAWPLQVREDNPPPPPIAPPWTLRVPALGLTLPVVTGDPNRVTDAGLGWHWTGTGYAGEAANVAVFAHRTESWGPFRHLQYLQPGDEWYLDTADGRRYVYVMTRCDLTDAQTGNILNATRFELAPSCSLIACTVGFDRTKSNYPDIWAPTSTLYRIVVTGRLDRWFAL